MRRTDDARSGPPEATLRRAQALLEEAAACLKALRLCGPAAKAVALMREARLEAQKRLRVDLLERRDPF